MCLHVNIWLCLSKEWESNPDAPDGPSDLFHPGWSVRFWSLWTKALSIHQTHPEIHRPATRYPCGLGHLKQQKYTDRSFFLKSGVKEWQKRFSNWPKFPGSRMAMEKVRDITRWDFKDEKQCFLLYIPGSQWSDARIGKIRFLVLVSAYSRLQLEGVTILQIGCNECVYNGSHVSSNKKSFTFGNGFEMEETSFHHRGNLLAKTYHLAFNVQVT